MTFVSIVVSRTAKLVAALAIGAALAGCMITSKEALVADAESQQVLPATVFFFGYEEDDAAPGTYKRSADPPMSFALSGNSYKSADGTTDLRFVPLDAPGTYLLAMAGADGSVYGTSVLRNNIIAANVILGDSDPAAIVQAEMAKGGDAAVLADVLVEEGELVVTSRPALDYLIGMTRDGRLQFGGLVMYIGETTDASVPAKLVPDGDFWKPEG